MDGSSIARRCRWQRLYVRTIVGMSCPVSRVVLFSIVSERSDVFGGHGS